MHFDILVPENVKEENIIFNFGKHYLATKGEEGSSLTASECQFCHIDQAPQYIIDEISAKGFSIIEMENCN